MKIKKIISKTKELAILSLIVIALFTAGVISARYHFNEPPPLEINTCEKEEAPEEVVRKLTEEAGLSWLKVFRLIECESNWSVFFKEKMKGGSYDRGLFAFNSYHYAHISDECAFSPECATKAFIEAYEAGEINNWLCARHLNFKEL